MYSCVGSPLIYNLPIVSTDGVHDEIFFLGHLILCLCPFNIHPKKYFGLFRAHFALFKPLE